MIKKITTYFCLLGLISSVLRATDKIHTNKTFLMPRSVAFNSPMMNTSFEQLYGRDSGHAYRTWSRDHTKKPQSDQQKSRFGLTTQTTMFYQESRGEALLSRYFLADNQQEITLTSVGDIAGAAGSAARDLDYDYIIHDATHQKDFGGVTVDRAPGNDNTAYLGLDPRRITQGTRMDLYCNLDALVAGLYFRASTALVDLEHDTRLRVTSSEKYVATTLGDEVPVSFALEGYFEGVFENTTPQNRQVALTKGLFKGKNRQVGFADIDCTFGYKIVSINRFSMHLGAGCTLPTGNKPRGEYLFQAVVGNGGHLGVGVDTDFQFDVWHDHENDVKLYGSARYRYLFSAQQQRTLGLKGHKLGQYKLVADVQAPAGAPLIPAANLTTLAVDVLPGSVFDGCLGMKYAWRGVQLDAGYNYYFKNRETLTQRGSIEKNRYAIAARKFDTSYRFGAYSVRATAQSGIAPGDGDAEIPAHTQYEINQGPTQISPVLVHEVLDDGVEKEITLYGDSLTGVFLTPPFGGGRIDNRESTDPLARQNIVAALNRQAARLPSTSIPVEHLDGAAQAVFIDQLVDVVTARSPQASTHGLYGSVGYVFDWNCPLLIAGGAQYEFALVNSDIEQWAVWAKIGFGF